jgi:LmbE family N-acetylglucosaminyl deacetylase
MNLDLRPPTGTTTISARRVLVMAAHADDEVFGCGGLLAGLAAAGADIRVLYLTDSSGGNEVTEGRDAYAERRAAEARRGLEILGVGGYEALAIPDGVLAGNVDSAAAAIQRAVLDHRPDLLLSLSPLEVTADHRAAFAALHRGLTQARGGSELDAILGGCRILLYEVNHPAYPNLLVDVSDRLEVLTAAIDAHASQLELHNYREAALGMRHFRALSLPASVRAAEGYREISPFDLRSHSASDLVSKLGGIPDRHELYDGPLVSVIVRTKDRPELLAEALASIAASHHRRVEVVLVNDGGSPPAVAGPFPFPVVRVELETNRGRAAAANAGITTAHGEYVCFLDDDDLMAPEHLATLVKLVSTPGVRVAYTDAAVGVYARDDNGVWVEVERRLPYSRDFEPDRLLVDNYIPFNTPIIDRALLAEVGPLDEGLEFFEDWELLIRLAAATPFRHLPAVTAEYRHFRGAGHHVLGDQPRRREDFLAMKAVVIGRQRDRLGPEVLARLVDRLRAEAVDAAETADAARRDAERLRIEHDRMTDSWHRLNGEREALRNERASHLGAIGRLEGELAEHRRAVAEFETEAARLRADESALRTHVAEQDGQLGRLYAEIDRLNRLVAAMEGTTAWKLHRTFERLRGRSS